MARETKYVSFLVRVWRLPSAGRDWLAQAERIPCGEKRYFSSLEELFAFISAVVEEMGNSDSGPGIFLSDKSGD